MNNTLFSYILDGVGGTKLLQPKHNQLDVNEQITWTHLDAKDPQSKEWLNKELSSSDPFITDALIAEKTRSRFTQINDGMLITLRGINSNGNDCLNNMTSIRLWIDKNRIISTSFEYLDLFDDIIESFKKNTGPKNSADFIVFLIEKLSVRIEPVLANIDDKLIDIEEQTIDVIDSDLRESVANLRRQIIVLRRYIVPQKDIIEQLRLSDLSWLSDSHKRYLVEIYNREIRYVEDLDEVNARLQEVKDQISNSLSDKINKKMYFLSIIAALFLPSSFLTGLMGVNVAGIPGSQNTHAFWIFLIILLSIVVLQIYLFKKLKWFLK
ncbi:zinc transporter ZntB [Francisella philomiragia]|uniref:CorA-like Mg2+ transporter family protein n=1 Tax=Francisella philomiragia TaxID=28110 RepID=A0AAW3DC20_9GAMM|nr:zinc transporter ZntB [Francisella philomiragia]KFJ43338.1 corA-like Mg2+ transporter family protein [Francisella philomiragia]MBK2106604.1 zinc transporter ZntB [Francisella philomiragia]MBK2254379.1 zinc transporter ZntB [Francisella philomiragia]MBK2272828.1 zinc transporter ZntB [Francisella philomiragia]MBK2276533.1 zinc transporter ZntB [Francisella philomiragia]